MTTPDKKTVAQMAISAVGLALLGWFVATVSCGCGSTPVGPNTNAPPDSNGIPNLSLVEPGVWRGGQPTEGGWAWLRSVGVSNVITLHTADEAKDDGAAVRGMVIHYHPIDTIQQLSTGPNDTEMKKAVSEITPGTIVHCVHGWDRTGLVIGMYRLHEGTNKAAAWAEMLNHGYHHQLFGLTDYWEKQ